MVRLTLGWLIDIMAPSVENLIIEAILEKFSDLLGFLDVISLVALLLRLA